MVSSGRHSKVGICICTKSSHHIGGCDQSGPATSVVRL